MKRYFYSFVTLLAVVLLASCSSEKDGTACLKLIPEDAALVMRIDLKSVGEAMDYQNDKEGKTMLKGLIDDMSDDKKVKDKLKSIIDNPAESGISGDNPVYFYMAPNLSNVAGLVGTTGDRDKLVELLETIAEDGDLDDVEKYEGISCLALDKAAFMVDDDWFYLGMGGDDLQERAKDLKELVKADKAPIMEHNDFKALTEKKGQVQMLISGFGLNSLINKSSILGSDAKQIAKLAKEVLPGKLSDVSVLFDATFAKGSSTGTAEVLTYSKEWKDAVGELDGIMGNISSEVAKYLSGDGLVMLANLDGDKTLALIEKLAAKFGQNLDNEDFNQVRQVLTAINGNMGFGISDMVNDMVEGALYISTKDASIIDLIASSNDSDTKELTKNGDNDYTLYQYDYDYDYMTGDFVKTNLVGVTNFGYKQGYTYATFSDKEGSAPFTAPAKAVPAVKGKGLYFYMGASIFDKFDQGNSMENEVMKEMSKVYDFVELYYEGNGKMVVRTVLTDKTASVLKVYADIIKKAFEAGYARGRGL